MIPLTAVQQCFFTCGERSGRKYRNCFFCCYSACERRKTSSMTDWLKSSCENAARGSKVGCGRRGLWFKQQHPHYCCQPSQPTAPRRPKKWLSGGCPFSCPLQSTASISHSRHFSDFSFPRSFQQARVSAVDCAVFTALVGVLYPSLSFETSRRVTDDPARSAEEEIAAVSLPLDNLQICFDLVGSTSRNSKGACGRPAQATLGTIRGIPATSQRLRGEVPSAGSAEVVPQER